ncbi:helix-turn-helix transcriptional regulator [Jatrophihabitans fulvus]
MRASRLLSLLLILSTRGRTSATDLARELEVSVRTVHRDVEALSAAGIPVYATRGRHGGVQLLDGYRTRLTGMTADEADALFLSGLPGAAADLGLGGTLAATQLKLLAALPPELRDRASRVRDRFHVDASDWLRERTDTTPPPCLDTVADAVWTQRRLDVRYERARRDVVERTLDPLGLVLKAGTWYLVAASEGRPPRTYRVSRVHSATVRDEAVARPDGFDLETFWSAFLSDYADRVYREVATVRVDATGRALLFLLGSIPARHARAAMGEPDADGWAVTTVPIESVRHAQHALLQLGEHLEVLAPDELRAAVAATVAALSVRYR